MQEEVEAVAVLEPLEQMPLALVKMTVVMVAMV
jgi:hypothetical protein